MALLTNVGRMLVARRPQLITRRMKSSAAYETFPPRHHWLILVTFPIPVWLIIGLPRIITANQSEGHHEKKH